MTGNCIHHGCDHTITLAILLGRLYMTQMYGGVSHQVAITCGHSQPLMTIVNQLRRLRVYIIYGDVIPYNPCISDQLMVTTGAVIKPVLFQYSHVTFMSGQTVHNLAQCYSGTATSRLWVAQRCIISTLGLVSGNTQLQVSKSTPYLSKIIIYM